MIARILRAGHARGRLAVDALGTLLGRSRISDRELAEAMGLRSADDLGSLSQAKGGRFFFRREDVPALADEFRRRYPHDAAAVIERADAVLRHEFDLLGSGPTNAGDSINWFADLMTKRSWRRSYSAFLPVRMKDRRTDIKRVWELSRCQHFGVLGQAYVLTGDEKYAREWVAQMIDWDRRNPPMLGPNWMVAMEVAIRIVNWVWGYFFMSGSSAFSNDAPAVFYRNVLSHGRFIMRHLESYGNHRFSDFTGLAVLGFVFPQLTEAAGWRRAAVDGLCDECKKQVREDGVHFEGSIDYHRLVLEMGAAAVLLMRRNETEVPAPVSDALARMFAFGAGYLKPDGSGPRTGDGDDGRLQELAVTGKRDHSYLLSLACAVTGDSSFKKNARVHPEAFWLLGREGLERFEALEMPGRKVVSQGFAESGFYVLRSGRLYCFVSCRRPDKADRGAHIHNDHLSFEACIGGVDVIVDPGTYVYTADIDARNTFRGTEAHNSIMVDGSEVNRLDLDDPFKLRDAANCTVTVWSTQGSQDVLHARHDGYVRLPGVFRVERTFGLDREYDTLRIRDRVGGEGEHRISWRFHLAPEVSARVEGNCVFLSAGPVAAVLELEEGEAPLRVMRGWHSPGYGRRIETLVASADVRAVLPIDVQWLLRPVSLDLRRQG